MTRQFYVDLKFPSAHKRQMIELDDALYQIVRLEAEKGTFTKSKQTVVSWVKDHLGAYEDDFLYYAFVAYLGAARSRYRHGKNGTEYIKVHNAGRNRMIQQKAKSFDRIINVLDTMYVGNNLLGDCKKPDLLRASVEAHRVAGEWDVKATLYKELAALLPDSETTVRKAAGRDKIVALLTTTFRE